MITELGVSWEYAKAELDKKTLVNVPPEAKPGVQLTPAFPVLLVRAGWSKALWFPVPLWDRSPGTAASQGSLGAWDSTPSS